MGIKIVLSLFLTFGASSYAMEAGKPGKKKDCSFCGWLFQEPPKKILFTTKEDSTLDWKDLEIKKPEDLVLLFDEGFKRKRAWAQKTFPEKSVQIGTVLDSFSDLLSVVYLHRQILSTDFPHENKGIQIQIDKPARFLGDIIKSFYFAISGSSEFKIEKFGLSSGGGANPNFWGFVDMKVYRSLRDDGKHKEADELMEVDNQKADSVLSRLKEVPVRDYPLHTRFENNKDAIRDEIANTVFKMLKIFSPNEPRADPSEEGSIARISEKWAELASIVPSFMNRIVDIRDSKSKESEESIVNELYTEVRLIVKSIQDDYFKLTKIPINSKGWY